MTAKLTSGKRLVKAIEQALPSGWEFDQADRLVLAEIESAETRRAALIALFESETARPSPSAHKTVALAAENPAGVSADREMGERAVVGDRGAGA